MYHLSKLCKIWLRLESENFEYLWFYLTFWVQISVGCLKLTIFLIYSLVMLQNYKKKKKEFFIELLLSIHFLPDLLEKKWSKMFGLLNKLIYFTVEPSK